MAIVSEAIKIAEKAGEVLLGYFGKDIGSIRKSDATPVSAADMASNSLITDMISQAFPDHFILSEEGGAEERKEFEAELANDLTAALPINSPLIKHKSKKLKKPRKDTIDNRSPVLKDGYTWIVDPLDGTSNFLHGLPYFCVSIACVEQKAGKAPTTVAGVVYNPVSRELYWAEKNNGAFLGEIRLQVSRTQALDQAFIACGYHGGDVTNDYGRAYIEVSRVADSSRRLGSAALDLAKTAQGVFDCFFDPVLQPWDIAAGSLLITEAGGYALNFPGLGQPGELSLMERGIIGGSPALVAAVSGYFSG